MTEYLPFRMWVYTVPVDERVTRGMSSQNRLERGFVYPNCPFPTAAAALTYADVEWNGMSCYLARIVDGVIVAISSKRERIDTPSLLAELNRNLNWSGKKEDPDGQATDQG